MNGIGSEQNWEAENDARTLAEASVIQKDSKRAAAAAKVAVDMANKKKEEAEAMRKVSTSQLAYPPPKSSVE